MPGKNSEQQMIEFFKRRDADKRKIDEFFSRLRITEEAYRKMNLYHSVIASALNRDDYECGGFMLTDIGRSDGVVRDIALFPSQMIKDWTVDLDSDYNFAKAYEFARNSGKKVLGGWHSHGGFSCFHSPADDGFVNHFYIFNRHNIPNMLKLYDEKVPFSGSGFSIEMKDGRILVKQNKEMPDPLVIELKDGSLQPFLLDAKDAYYQIAKGVTYAMSIVINSKTASTVESDLKSRSSICDCRIIRQKDPRSDETLVHCKNNSDRYYRGGPLLELEFVGEKSGITIDDKVMLEEAYRCVSVEGVSLRDYRTGPVRKASTYLKDAITKAMAPKKEEKTEAKTAETIDDAAAVKVQNEPIKTENKPADTELTENIKRYRLERLKQISMLNDAGINEILDTERIAKERDPQGYMVLLRKGTDYMKNVYLSAKKSYDTAAPEMRQELKESMDYLASLIESTWTAYTKGYQKKFKMTPALSREAYLSFLEGKNPVVIADDLPQTEVGKKNGQPYEKK